MQTRRNSTGNVSKFAFCGLGQGYAGSSRWFTSLPPGRGTLTNKSVSSGVARGATGSTRPGTWGACPGGASTHFIQPFKNVFLNRNIDKMCLKMRIF